MLYRVIKNKFNRTYTSKDISNYLGDYFVNVGKQYALKIVPSSTPINEYLWKIDQKYK